MPLPLLAVAGASLLPSVFKGISSIFQKKKANSINPVDPNYQVNNAVIDNAENLTNRANNYVMPGYGGAMNNINSTYSDAFNSGVQGATNSGDVLDLATRIAYGKGRAQNQLAVQNAQGKENAYLQSLSAQEAAGREFQNKNAYDREQYMNQLREKAALTQAANENAYGALNDIGSVGSNILMNQLGSKGTSTVTANPLGSIFTPDATSDDYKSLLGNYSVGLNRPVSNYTRRF